MSLVKLDCFPFLRKLFLFHLSMYSSISVRRPLPLSVRLSPLNKQTRSSCQLCPSPTPDLMNQSQPDGIPNMQLFDPLFAKPSTMRRGYACVVIETNMVLFFWLTLFNIIFQPSFFAPCDFLSSISICFLLSVIQPLSVRIIGHSAIVPG